MAAKKAKKSTAKKAKKSTAKKTKKSTAKKAKKSKAKKTKKSKAKKAKKTTAKKVQPAPPVDRRIARRFEFKNDKSEKFWEIRLHDTSHTVTYGRIGSGGMEKTKYLTDIESAIKSYDKLVRSKTKKGYVELAPVAPLSKKEIAAAEAYATNIDPFVEKILQDPDNIENYSILGDWLTEQGDPRGEFFEIQIALEDDSLSSDQRKELRIREQKLLTKHQRTWLGKLAQHLLREENLAVSLRGDANCKIHFARGMLCGISMKEFLPELGHALKESIHCSTLKILMIDQTVHLHEPLTIGDKTYEGEIGIETLLGAKFKNLRSFYFGESVRGSCYTNGEHAVDVISNMPRIEKLRLQAHKVDTTKLFQLEMPHLQSLTVHHLVDYPVELLANNKSLSNLETLEMQPHSIEWNAENAYLRLEHIEAIGKSANLGSLTNIRFRQSDMGDAGVEAIVKTGLLKRLKTLDLTFGCITDAGVEMLLAAGLSNLERLDLNRNAITSAGVEALEKSGVKHSASNQHRPDAVDRLEHYLCYGDME